MDGSVQSTVPLGPRTDTLPGDFAGDVGEALAEEAVQMFSTPRGVQILTDSFQGLEGDATQAQPLVHADSGDFEEELMVVKVGDMV